MIDVSVDDVPDNSSAHIIRSITIGDNDCSVVDSGGYNVQPVDVPNSVFVDVIVVIYVVLVWEICQQYL